MWGEKLLGSCTQNISYITVKNPPSAQENQATFPKTKLMQKPHIGFFQLDKHGNKRKQLHSDFLLNSFQTKSAA